MTNLTIQQQLSSAASSGNLDLVQQLTLLLSKEDFNDCISYILYNSVIFNHAHIVRYWLEIYAIEDDNNQMINFEEKFKENCLRISSENGNMEITKLLLEYGWNIHYENDVALRKSSYNGHSDVVKLLINNGAQLDIENNIVLINACSLGDFDLVQFLVELGADINTSINPLFHACSENHLKIVRYLVEKGVNIHSFDDVSLKTSCQREHLDIIGFLYEQYEDKNYALAIINSYQNTKINSFIQAQRLEKSLIINNSFSTKHKL